MRKKRKKRNKPPKPDLLSLHSLISQCEISRPTVRESARDKSVRYLCEGRLIVESVDGVHARATCRGDAAVWRVELNGTEGTCTCPARGRCAHLLALGHVVALNQ
jgi:uncharacterized Zn finger protein